MLSVTRDMTEMQLKLLLTVICITTAATNGQRPLNVTDEFLDVTQMTIVDPTVNTYDVTVTRPPYTAVCSHTSLYSIDCSNRSLLSVPRDFPPHMESLYLDNNNLSAVDAEDFSALSGVQYIGLHHNSLAVLPYNVFSNCSSLRCLNVSFNSLSSLDFVLSVSCLTELYATNNVFKVIDSYVNMSCLETLDVTFNQLTSLPASLAAQFANVQTLKLANNLLEKFEVNDFIWNSLETLDLSSNRIRHFSLCEVCHLPGLKTLDLGNNQLISLSADWFTMFPDLTWFSARHNPISMLEGNTFCASRHLATLHLNYLSDLVTVDCNAFSGLAHLQQLDLSHNKQLKTLHRDTFADMNSLAQLDLSSNGLTSLLPGTLSPVKSLQLLSLADNPWTCQCPLYDALQYVDHTLTSTDGAVCASPPALNARSIFNRSMYPAECHAARAEITEHNVWAYVGSDIALDCGLQGDKPLNVTWLWNKRRLHADNITSDTSNVSDAAASTPNNSITVLSNGSLLIASVTRMHTGRYVCVVSNTYGNATAALFLRLNYEAISIATLHSIIIGLISSAAFFCIAVVIGAVRYFAYVCSSKEKRKRKSIREVLDAIQDYKSAQFDKFSAYRMAKLDQLSALKSATMCHLSAFRHTRIDRLRTYKQATITSILAHLERMRDHYAAQTARIKDNCTQQADRLKESYGSRCGRFKDYRSQQVDKMRENYAMQAARIRDYGQQQMSRLREQYKTQQQHVLKLVELLDVGSCVTGVIEAECMKAESMIFDADIAFDFEAQSVHAVTCGSIDQVAANHGSDSDCSEYLTASDSDIPTSANSIACVADIVPIKITNLSNGSSSSQDMVPAACGGAEAGRKEAVCAGKSEAVVVEIQKETHKDDTNNAVGTNPAENTTHDTNSKPSVSRQDTGEVDYIALQVADGTSNATNYSINADRTVQDTSC